MSVPLKWTCHTLTSGCIPNPNGLVPRARNDVNVTPPVVLMRYNVALPWGPMSTLQLSRKFDVWERVNSWVQKYLALRTNRR